MANEIYHTLQEVELITSFIPVTVLMLTKSKTRLQLRRVLYALSIAWLISEAISLYLYRSGINTFLIFHIYSSISTVAYLFYFKLALPEWITRKVVLLSSGVYLIMQWGIIVITDGYFTSITVVMVLTSLIPFILSLLTFYAIAKEIRYSNLLSEPIYWVTCSILVHFGLSIVALFSLEFLSNNASLLVAIWPLVLISNIVHNAIFSIGVWKTNQV